jgi:hypothetical protein
VFPVRKSPDPFMERLRNPLDGQCRHGSLWFQFATIMEPVRTGDSCQRVHEPVTPGMIAGLKS